MCLCKEHSLVCKHVNYTQLVKEIRTSSVTSSMCGAEQSEAQTASKRPEVESNFETQGFRGHVTSPVQALGGPAS